MKRHLSKMRRKIVLILFFAIPSLALAQTHVVSGTVAAPDDGEGLPGVTVMEKGTTHGVSTDIDGKYTIEVSSPSAVLVYSMLGMVTQEKPVKGTSEINLTLKADEKMLEEVVVTGYTSQRKADLTGAVSVVSVADMMTEAENNPIKALQGRVAGVEITSDGNPSGSATVRIRGISSLESSKDPLYVIDGIPTNGGMHELNSNDIESIQVLKDASSASIYGSRAANGVVIITTKKGEKGKVKVNFDSYITQSWYDKKLQVLNSKEYGEALWLSNVNSGSNPNANTIGYQFDWGYDANGNPVLNNMYLPKYVDAGKTMLTSDTDWFNEVSKKGLAQSYNVSVSNGTDRGNYFLSLGYYNNNGTIKYTDFERFSGRINGEYKIFGDILTIGENFTINKTSELTAPDNVLDMSLKMLPMVPVRTVDGKGWGGPTPNMNDRLNPVMILYNNRNNNYDFWRIFGNAYLNLQPVKGLNIRSSFGLDYSNFYKRFMQPTYTSGKLVNNTAYIIMDQNFTNRLTWTNTANYAKTIEKHQFDVLGGIEMYKETWIGTTARKEGFINETPEQMWPKMGTGTALLDGSSTEYTLLSYFGKANYSYDNRYLASFVIRYDGSSRFGENNRFGLFPGVSLGWRLSEEPFMEKTRNVLSDLKLRAAWGQNGNQGISNFYAAYTLFVPDYGTGDPTWTEINGTSYDLNGNETGELPSGYKRTQIGNPDLKWETTTQTNIGLDFGFLQQSIYGSAEIYLKQTEDMLVLPPYLGVLGEGAYKWYNGASMENRGYEVTLGYKKMTAFGLSYDISGNISGYQNKVTKLPDDVVNAYGGNGEGDNILGHPIGSFYGYIADGIFRTEDEVNAHAEQEGKGLGRIRYRDINGDGTVDDDDRTWIGSPHPDFIYGLNIALEYKNFDLSVFFQGVQGIDLDVYAVKSQTDFWSVNDVMSNKGTRLLDAWSATNPGSDIPALQALDTNNEGRFSTYYVESGSYLKLKNIQLGYTLPISISKKIAMNKLRLYVSAQNVFTIKSKNFSGVDPENPAFGYPIPVTLTGGLSISF